MVLAPGTRLGVFLLAEQIGRGGMGDVYRARDTKLDRDVAIKILPEAFAHDAARLARFEREAKILASLNDPNIAIIHGLEQAGDIHALVMELVPGDDLSQRIARGPIPLDEALPIATQIAEALEAAHEQGIIHRDLKPANIKVRSDGTVKVLDFGLAKALAPAGSQEPAYENLTQDPGYEGFTQSPTMTTPAHLRQGYGEAGVTGVGMILGTAAYMSPEQARGKTVDKRADIWAFGAVLFEMLTGKRAFPGEDLADTLGAVVKLDPPWDAVRDVPPRLQQVLRVCLQKDLKQRAGDIHDVRLALEGAFETPDSQAMGAGTTSASPRRRPLLAVLGGAAAVAALVGTVIGIGVSRWTTPKAPAPQVTRTDVALPPGVTEIGPSINNVDVSISADGRRIAYLAAKNGVEQLYVRSLDQLETRLILSGTTAEIRGPAMSPDGNWIAFLDENANRLKKIAVSGGPPTIVGPALGATRGIVWDGNDTIVLATSVPTTGILRVRAAGGTPEVLTTPKAGEDHVYPFALPGKNAILFTLVTQAAPNQIILLNLDTRQETRLIANGSNARYSPSGHLLYVADGSLRAVTFDLNRLEVRGEAVPVVNEVATKGVGAGQFALSATGTLFYLHGKIGASARTLVWVDRLGREEPTGIPPNSYATAQLSPDGARVAVDTRELRPAISTWDLSRRILTSVVVGPASSIDPLWSPDGRRIAFAAERDGGRNIWWQNADGTGSPERLTQGGQQAAPTAFTPDGKGLLLREPDGAPYDVGFADLTTGRHDLLLHASYNESNAVLSPNGKWLAYQSNESGQEEIYVRPFPNIEAGRWKLSTGGGTRPVWARNGRELFFYLPPGRVWAVPVREGSTFSFDSPQVIIDGNYPAPNWGRQYDVSADGSRFLMLKSVADPRATPSQLVLVQNWFEELNRLAPTK